MNKALVILLGSILQADAFVVPTQSAHLRSQITVVRASEEGGPIGFFKRLAKEVDDIVVSLTASILSASLHSDVGHARRRLTAPAPNNMSLCVLPASTKMGGYFYFQHS